MEIATTTFDDDAFLHRGGRIRHWGEETSELPALTPDSTYAIRIDDRRRRFRRVAVSILGVLAVSAIVGFIVRPSLRADASASLARRPARTASGELTPLLDAPRSLAPTRHVRTARGRSK